MFKFLLLSALLLSSAFAHFDYAGNCASGNCLGTPAGCVDTQNCDIVAHYAKDGDNFHFEVEANWNNLEGDVEGKWVGIALGLDGGRGMGNDAAVACFADADGNAHADNYWNVLEYAASPTGFFSLPVADATGGLSDASLDIENGFIHCSYTRAAVTEILTPTETPETVVVDLNTIPYFLMMATGGLGEDGFIRIHSKAGISEEAIDFSAL